MKKRILSFLLALAMVVGMTVPAVSAEETETPAPQTPAQIGAAIAEQANAMVFPEDGSDYVAECPACGKEVTWVPLSGSPNTGNAYVTVEGSHYYLTQDVRSTSTLAALYVTKSACVHLNGYDVISTGAVTSSGETKSVPAIDIVADSSYNGTLTLFGPSDGENPSILTGRGEKAYSPAGLDTPAGWTFNIYGGQFLSDANAPTKSPLIVMGSGATNVTVNMYAGVLDGNQTGVVDYPGVMQLGNVTAEFNMYGGTIQNGNSNNGGNIMITDGVFNMYGGLITDGTATKEVGGNVKMLPSPNATKISEFNMYGGEITAGKATGTAETEGGGNVSVGTRNDIKAHFNLYGGKISKGEATYGGNIKVIGGEFYMKDGTLEGFGSNTYKSNYGANIHAYSGLCTIDGGILTNAYAQYRGGNIYASGSATVIVNGGTFSQSRASAGGNIAAYSSNTTTVNGGTFSVAVDNYNNFAVHTATVINDATLTNGLFTIAKNSTTAGVAPVIHHGVFSMEIAESYLAEGAAVFTVEGGNAVHKSVSKQATDATCTEPGLKEHTGCAVCDLVLQDGAWVTREAAGVIDEPAHIRTLVPETPSTCDKAGNKAYYACSCDKFYEDEAATKEIADLADWKANAGALKLAEHAYVYSYESVTTHTVTCENCAYTATGDHNTKTAACDLCGAKQIRLKIAGVQAPDEKWTKTESEQIFTFGLWSGVEKVEAAWNEGNIYIELYSGETLLMTSTMVEDMYDGVAQFVLKGESTRWTTKLAEGVVLSDETIPTKALLYVDGVMNQTFTGKNTVNGSIFNETQYKAYLQMSGSGHQHTLNAGEQTTPATCQAAGELTQTCSVCDGTVKTPIAQKTHEYDPETGICKNGCGNTKCANDGHTWGEEIAKVDATCAKTGFAAHYRCSECEAYAVKDGDTFIVKIEQQLTIAIDETAHKYNEPEYTDNEDGKTHTKLEVCANDSTHVNEILDLEHEYGEDGKCVCGAEKPQVEETKEAMVNGQKYDNLEDALTAAAQSEEPVTIDLLKDTEVGLTTVADGVTLNLNGKTLTVAEGAYIIACFETSFITDTEGTGRIVVDIDHLLLLQNNGQLPVQTDDGIMFVDAALQSNWSTKDNCFKFWFDEETTDAALIDQLKLGSAASKLKIQVELSWNGGLNKMAYVYEDAVLAQYLEKWNDNACLTMGVKNVGSIDDLTFTARVVFADGTEAEVNVVGAAVEYGAGAVS